MVVWISISLINNETELEVSLISAQFERFTVQDQGALLVWCLMRVVDGK